MDMMYNVGTMNIQFSLLSVCSAVILLLFCSCGYDVSLDRLYLTASVSSSETTFGIHPMWAVLVPGEIALLRHANGMAFGNVMILGDHLDGVYADYVIAHERIHLTQFRALGVAIWPSQFILNIEPDRSLMVDWNDPRQPARTMWTPPSWWPYKWSFVTITIGGDV